jgi:hypothetical protein
MKPHKWHKEIKAWADGAEIEWRTNNGSMHTEWKEAGEIPNWHIVIAEFRIKPQPKEPDFDATEYQRALKKSAQKFKEKIEKTYAEVLDKAINELAEPKEAPCLDVSVFNSELHITADRLFLSGITGKFKIKLENDDGSA